MIFSRDDGFAHIFLALGVDLRGVIWVQRYSIRPISRIARLCATLSPVIPFSRSSGARFVAGRELERG
jgi:hypothetical protein